MKTRFWFIIGTLIFTFSCKNKVEKISFDINETGGMTIECQIDPRAFFRSLLENYTDPVIKKIINTHFEEALLPLDFLDAFEADVLEQDYDISTCFKRANPEFFGETNSTHEVFSLIRKRYDDNVDQNFEYLKNWLSTDSVVFNAFLNENKTITLQCMNLEDSTRLKSAISPPNHIAFYRNTAISNVLSDFIQLDSTLFPLTDKDLDFRTSTGVIKYYKYSPYFGSIIETYPRAALFDGKLKIPSSTTVDLNGVIPYISPDIAIGLASENDTSEINYILRKNPSINWKSWAWLQAADDPTRFFLLMLQDPEIEPFQNEDFKAARVVYDEPTEMWGFECVLTFAGERKFHNLMINNLDQNVAVMLDNELVSNIFIDRVAPQNTLTIIDSFTQREVERIVNKINNITPAVEMQILSTSIK